MSKQKAVNYSTDEIQAIMLAYQSEDTDDGRKEAIKDLSEDLNRSVASIRSKLVNMGLYIKPMKVTKTGEKVESKGSIVNEIAGLVGASVEAFDSLEKANKSVLQVLRKALTPSDASETVEV